MRSKLQREKVGVMRGGGVSGHLAGGGRSRDAGVRRTSLWSESFAAAFQGDRGWADGRAAADTTERAEPAVRTRAIESYGKLPLSFEANQGQTDRQVKFLAHGGGYSLFLTGDEAVLSLQKGSRKSKVESRTRLAPAFRPAHERSADLAFRSAAFPGCSDRLRGSQKPIHELPSSSRRAWRHATSPEARPCCA